MAAPAAIPAIVELVTLIVGLWVVTHPPKIPSIPSPAPPLPESPPSSASIAGIIGQIAAINMREKALSSSKEACAHCPPCIPPVGGKCVVFHWYPRNLPHSPCLPPNSMGHIHVLIRHQNYNNCQCFFDRNSRNVVCVSSSLINSAVVSAVLGAGLMSCPSDETGDMG